MEYRHKSIVSRLLVICCMLTSTMSANAQDGEKSIGVSAVIEAVESLSSDLRVPARYALIIGASEFEDDRIPDLPACNNDALGLYNVLTDPTIGMFPKDQVKLLVDDQVSRRAVIDALDELGRQAGPDDLVLVFFSGHGAVDSRGRSYWVMQNTQVDKLRATALPENEITDLLADIRTTRLVTMIDACFSASTASLGDNKSIIDLKKIFPEFDGKGRIAMTASAGDQLSVVIPEGKPGYGYSAFAYHLIEGLKGHADGAGGQSKEGVITVDELWSYVKDRTETTARKAGGNQRPQLKGAFGSRFMLTIDSQRLVATSQTVKQQIIALKALLLDDKITGEHYEQAKDLLETPIEQLDEQGQKLRKVYVDMVEGRLAAEYLGIALNAIGVEKKPIVDAIKPERVPAIENRETEQGKAKSEANSNDKQKFLYFQMSTSMGDIFLELNNELAPISTANFLAYTEAGFYDGTIFHRVISNFMIQGGGYDVSMTKKAIMPGIENEWANGLSNVRGSVAVARFGSQANSGTSQFFINTSDNAFLDQPRDGSGYAVFGRIVKGMDVIDKIRNVPTRTKGGMSDVPINPVVIERMIKVEAARAGK